MTWSRWSLLWCLGMGIPLFASSLACRGGVGKPATHFTGRVLEQTVLLLRDNSPDAVPDSLRQSLFAAGISVDTSAGVIETPSLGVAGRWVHTPGSSRWYPTDADGFFQIPDLTTDPASTRVAVYREILDDLSEGDFQLSDLQPDAATMAPGKILRRVVSFPTNMNESTDVATTNALIPFVAPTDGCATHCDASDPAVVGDKEGCCLDYDGAWDHVARDTTQATLECIAKVEGNFTNSTCFDWSFLPERDYACSNESAFCKAVAAAEVGLDRESGPLFYKKLADCLADQSCQGKYNAALAKCKKQRPNCYLNHKYRNCQNLDNEDFHVSPDTASVAAGGSVVFHVRNNTVANRTIIDGFTADSGDVTASAGGVPVTVTALDSLRVINHYSDAKRVHYKDVDVTYTAPKTPKCSNRCECTRNQRMLNFAVGPAATGQVVGIKPSKAQSIQITIELPNGIGESALRVGQVVATGAAQTGADSCPTPPPAGGNWALTLAVMPFPAPGEDITGQEDTWQCLGSGAMRVLIDAPAATGTFAGNYTGKFIPNLLQSAMDPVWQVGATAAGTVSGLYDGSKISLTLTGDVALTATLWAVGPNFEWPYSLPDAGQLSPTSVLWEGPFTNGPGCVARSGYAFGSQRGLAAMTADYVLCDTSADCPAGTPTPGCTTGGLCAAAGGRISQSGNNNAGDGGP